MRWIVYYDDAKSITLIGGYIGDKAREANLSIRGANVAIRGANLSCP